MKTGDIVTVHDGSYGLFYDGTGVPRRTVGLELRSRRWRVLVTDVTLPTDRPADTGNDTMLCEVVAPEQILFTQARFCTIASQPTKEPDPLIVENDRLRGLLREIVVVGERK